MKSIESAMAEIRFHAIEIFFLLYRKKKCVPLIQVYYNFDRTTAHTQPT